MEVVSGLASLGFWVFLSAVVVARIWFDARKRESQQETLRRIVESGQQLDTAIIDRMLGVDNVNERPDHDLKVAGIITMFASPGLLILGSFLGKFNDKIFEIMIGVAILVLLVGAGIFFAGLMLTRWRQRD